MSTRGDYASRALLSLALHGGDQPTSVRDIAERTGLPQPYLEQILLALKGAGLVRSKRGVGGGYVLARPPEKLTLGQIVAAVDGPIVVGDFGEPHVGGACDHEGQCVLLTIWAAVSEHMRAHLDSYTLAELVRRVRGEEVADGELTGPELAGPELAGPELAGPELAGPELAGPELAGPELARPALA